MPSAADGSPRRCCTPRWRGGARGREAIPCLYSRVPVPDSKAPPLSRRLRSILSLDDFEHAARRHLPPPVFAYVSGGVETNAALRDNRAAFEELGFIPRI